MKPQEFSQKDTELLAQINEYRRQCYDHEVQIAINQREITLLEQERVELRNKYISKEESL